MHFNWNIRKIIKKTLIKKPKHLGLGEPTNANPMNIKIQKFIVKLTIIKKVKIRFEIELDIMITCTETPRL
jgi:hypothetical protein